MADGDLDKYLEDIGISMGEEEETEALLQQRQFEESVLPSTPVLVPSGMSAAERTESFLVNLLLNFDPAYAVEIEHYDEEEVNVEIFGGDPGKIIGRGGRTLSALEQITNAVVNRDGGQVRVNVDVGGYKRRRDERLRQEAQRAADRVRKNGEPIELEPMTAAERRVVHMALAEVLGVRSESTGEGRDRRVVVYPD